MSNLSSDQVSDLDGGDAVLGFNSGDMTGNLFDKTDDNPPTPTPFQDMLDDYFLNETLREATTDFQNDHNL